MAALVNRLARESELEALRIQEQELQSRQDALLAQRLALAYVCGEAGDIDDSDVEFVMEVAANEDGQAEAALVENQLKEVRSRQGKLEAENLRDLIAQQLKAANDSRLVAEVLNEQERWREKVSRHDAAFARQIHDLSSSDWEEYGDDLAQPLNLPPPRQLPRAADDLDTAPSKGAKRPPECTTTERGVAPRPLKAPARHVGSQPSACRAPNPGTSQQGNAASNQTGPSGSCVSTGNPRTASRSTGAAAPGAGPTGSAGARPLEGTVECLCCFDRFPEHAVSCAGSDAPSSSTGAAGCGHYFCSGCVSEYVVGAVRDRKYPVTCPMASGAGGGGCKMQLSRDCVMAALEKHPQEQQTFGMLEAEQAIDPSLRIYCPHKSCSTPLLRPEDGDMPQDAPTACPACFRAFCPRCLIAGWHNGYTCAQFQALPAHLRSAEDAAMLQFSARQQWKQCPQCKLMVERSEGCNHMKCRCGRQFCYACGKPYTRTAPTADNNHGTPACGCPLFDIPEDVPDRGNYAQGAGGAGGAGGGGAGGGGGRRRNNDSSSDSSDDDGGGYPGGYEGGYEGGYDGGHHGGYQGGHHGGYNGGPVWPGPGYVPVQPVPWRGGRMVSRRHCQFSASLYDCPYGIRCWFWHEVEDGPL